MSNKFVDIFVTFNIISHKKKINNNNIVIRFSYTEKKTSLKFQQINLYVDIIEAQQIYLLNLGKLLSSLF